MLIVTLPSFAGFDDLDLEDQEIVIALSQNPDLIVTEVQEGVIVKRRTERTPNPESKEELKKLSNQIGILEVRGEFSLGNASENTFRPYFRPNRSNTIVGQDYKFGLQLGGRIPYRILRRLTLGGGFDLELGHSGGSGWDPSVENSARFQRGDGPDSYPIHLFADFDAITFSKGSKVISFAYIQTRDVISNWDHEFHYSEIPIRQNGLQFTLKSLRPPEDSGGSLGYYVMLRLYKNKSNSIGFGVSHTFGKRVPVKRDTTK